MQETLQAVIRPVGKGAAHLVRRQGAVPAVVYGHGLPPVAVAVDHAAISRLLATVGRNAFIRLRVPGHSEEAMDVMIKDIQLDLLKGILLHLDFFRVAKGEKISVDVPVAIRGEQEVEKAGLVIQHQLRQVKVEAVPGTIPDAAIANVSGLGAGDSLTVADLSLTGEGVILDAGDEVVLSIIAPRAVTVHEDEEGEEAEQEAEEPAENPE